MSTTERKSVKRVAVVGGGVAGLSTAWILENGKPKEEAQDHVNVNTCNTYGFVRDEEVRYQVTLFEKEKRLGGHTWTVQHTDENTKQVVDIDLGFQGEFPVPFLFLAFFPSLFNSLLPILPSSPFSREVFNLSNYGNLCELFECLNVDSQPSIMSFAFSKQKWSSEDESERKPLVEWSSNNGIFGIFNNLPSDLCEGNKWMLAKDLIRFEKDAERILCSKKKLDGVTLEKWMSLNKYSEAFAEHYMYPMCGAIWSSPKNQVKQFPIVWLVRFICNHHLEKVTNMQRPLWRVVKDGSSKYVEKIAENLRAKDVKVNLGSAVRRIGYMKDKKVYVLHYLNEETGECKQEEFDLLVLAVHADVALKMVSAAEDNGSLSLEEEDLVHLEPFRNVLRSIPYHENKLILHKDKNWMPVHKKSWTSWNVLERDEGRREDGNASSICMSYWANLLASFPDACKDYFVTLNPWTSPDKKEVLMETSLAHPQFSVKADKAQQSLKKINGQFGFYLCGAWCGYGFHEDGVRSAVDVCDRLGVMTPWHYRESYKHLNKPERLCPLDKQFNALDPSVSYRQAFYIFLFDKYMKRCIRKGFLRIVLPSGKELCYGDPNTTEVVETHVRGQKDKRDCICGKSLKLRSKLRIFDVNVFEAIVVKTDIGLGEAFFQGKFAVDDLLVFMSILSKNLTALNASTNKWVLGLMNFFGEKWTYLKWLLRSNTILNSRKNIEEHYDAGNDMYKLFLDSRMVYSCAIYTGNATDISDDGDDVLTFDDLEMVQMRKLREIVQRCGIQKNDSVLEIGCGWGAMAMLLAKEYDCNVTGITLSTEQLEECNKRARIEGVEGKCTFLLCDYRRIPQGAGGGKKLYDAIISVEMIEAVGHEWFGTYFQQISRWLKPGGKATVQAISLPDERYDQLLYASDFIKEHIFPGGHLPCLSVMLKHANTHSLHLSDCIDIGKSYAITLMEWRENWLQRYEEVRKLGYSEEFFLKYLFYFVYCEVGFNEELLLDYILTFTKSESNASVKKNI